MIRKTTNFRLPILILIVPLSFILGWFSGNYYLNTISPKFPTIFSNHWVALVFICILYIVLSPYEIKYLWKNLVKDVQKERITAPMLFSLLAGFLFPFFFEV